MSDNPLQILLDDDTAPGTRLDAAALTAAGRRRVRRRQAAVAGVAAAVVLVLTAGVAGFAATRPRTLPPGRPPAPTAAASPDGTAATGCVASLLAVPGGAKTHTVVVDPTGRWAAALLTTGDNIVFWHDGAQVGVAQSRAITMLAGISAGGTAAGVGYDDHQRARAMTFKPGYSVILTRPPGVAEADYQQATAVNAGGDVVGWVDTGGRRRPVLWPRQDPIHPRLLPAPAGHGAQATSVSDDGWVGGFVDGVGEADPRPYVWSPDGTATELPHTGGAAVTAMAGGWAADLAAGQRWRLPGGAPEPLAGLDGLGRRAVTADGAVLLANDERAVLLRAGRLTDLRPPDGYTNATAFSADAAGTVVVGKAANQRANGGGAPVLWRCAG